MTFLKQYGFSVLVACTVLLRLLDSYKSPDSIYNIIGYSSGFILAWIFAIIIISRVSGIIVFPKKIITVLIILGSVFISGSFVLAYVNFLMYENFIFGLTQIRIGNLFNLGMFLFFAGTLSLPSSFLKQHYQKLIFALGIFLFILYYAYGFFPLDARHQIAKEDSLAENFQFLFLLLSGIFSLIISAKMRTKRVILSVIFAVLSLGLFFVAGDEISWGQRILGLETPESVVLVNAQDEISVHNHVWFHGETPYAFMLVGLYGSSMWFVYKVFKKSLQKIPNIAVFIPPACAFPFFFAGFFYNFYTSLGDHTIGDWSEPTELMLYMGVFFYLLLLCKLPKEFTKKS